MEFVAVHAERDDSAALATAAPCWPDFLGVSNTAIDTKLVRALRVSKEKLKWRAQAFCDAPACFYTHIKQACCNRVSFCSRW